MECSTHVLLYQMECSCMLVGVHRSCVLLRHVRDVWCAKNDTLWHCAWWVACCGVTCVSVATGKTSVWCATVLSVSVLGVCAVCLCMVCGKWLSLDCPVWDGHRSSPNHIYRYLMLTMMGTYFNLRRLNCILGILWGVLEHILKFWGISFEKYEADSLAIFFPQNCWSSMNLFIQHKIPLPTLYKYKYTKWILRTIDTSGGNKMHQKLPNKIFPPTYIPGHWQNDSYIFCILNTFGQKACR